VESHVPDPGAPQSVVDLNEFLANDDYSWPALPVSAVLQAADAVFPALPAKIAHSTAGEQLPGQTNKRLTEITGLGKK